MFEGLIAKLKHFKANANSSYLKLVWSQHESDPKAALKILDAAGRTPEQFESDVCIAAKAREFEKEFIDIDKVRTESRECGKKLNEHIEETSRIMRERTQEMLTMQEKYHQLSHRVQRKEKAKVDLIDLKNAHSDLFK